MRLMLVTNGLRYGGAERIVQALAHHARDAGHAVHVVATTRGGPIRDALKAAKIPVSVLHIKSAFDVRVPLKLANVARHFGAQVLHSHLAVADIATASTSKLLPRLATLTTIHNGGVELSRARRALWHFALGRFHRILAVSGAVRMALPARLAVDIVRPSLVDDGPPLLTRVQAREQLGVPADAKLVLGVGRLDPIKGFDVLAAAVGRLPPAVKVMVIGEGSERSELERMNGLQLFGARDDAADLIAAADVVVCPSRSEGFPQVPLHAMAVGVPVVATNVGGTAEIVVPGETGWLVPPETPIELASAIIEALDDPSEAKARGARGRARLRDAGLTRHAMLETYLGLYESLASTAAS